MEAEKVTIVKRRRSADRCTGITWCNVNVDRSRGKLANEVTLHCQILLTSFFLFNIFSLASLLSIPFCLFSPAYSSCFFFLWSFSSLCFIFFLSSTPAFILSPLSHKSAPRLSCTPTPCSLFSRSYLLSLSLFPNDLKLYVTKSQCSQTNAAPPLSTHSQSLHTKSNLRTQTVQNSHAGIFSFRKNLLSLILIHSESWFLTSDGENGTQKDSSRFYPTAA